MNRQKDLAFLATEAASLMALSQIRSRLGLWSWYVHRMVITTFDMSWCRMYLQ